MQVTLAIWDSVEPAQPGDRTIHPDIVMLERYQLCQRVKLAWLVITAESHTYIYIYIHTHLISQIFARPEQHSTHRSKIKKKSVILFWLLNMTLWCKHFHKLELEKFFNFCAAHLPVRLDIETKFPYFLFLTWLSIIRNQEFRLYI